MARSWLLASALLGCPTLIKAYNQSLLDCKAVAAEFRNTCAHGDYDTPAASMAAMAGATFACSPKHRCITGGTQSGNTCSWERKLCVTCRDDGGVTKIRIQTNNLPDHCVVTSSIKAKNFDYEVIFNAKETYGTWERTITTQAQLDNAVCPIVKRMDTDGNLQITEFGDAESANAMGIAVNGVAYQFANQIREDPVYPITVLNEQPLDICMGHNQLNSDSGMYHYHNLSPCLNPNFLTGKVMASCEDTTDCAADITAWVTGGYTSWGTTKRVIGVSKDGHVMYGPYDSSAQLWAADNVDACNGAWSSDFQEYFYAGTQWHPYGPGCQGPANFPQQQGLYPQCSLNGMRQYDTTQTTMAPSAAPATSTAAVAGTTGAPDAPVVTTTAPVTQGPGASPAAGTSTGPSSSGATPTPSPRPVPAVVQPAPASTPSSTASPTVAPTGSSAAPTGTATPTAAPVGSPPTTAPGSSGTTAAPTSAPTPAPSSPPTSAPSLIEPVSAASCMRALGLLVSWAGTLALL